MELPVITVVSSGQLTTATKTVTSSVALSIVKLIDINLSRKGLMIYNNSANSIYLGFGDASVSSSTCAAILATFTQYTSGTFCYTGAIYGIRNAGSGTCTVVEFT